MNIQMTCPDCGKKLILLQNQKTGNYAPVLFTELITAERIDLENNNKIEVMFNPMHHRNHYHTCKERK